MTERQRKRHPLKQRRWEDLRISFDPPWSHVPPKTTSREEIFHDLNLTTDHEKLRMALSASAELPMGLATCWNTTALLRVTSLAGTGYVMYDFLDRDCISL